VKIASLGGVLLLITAAPTVCQAELSPYFNPYYQHAREAYGLRHYYLYPYHYSVGTRYDPYWSYNSSYFPQTYQGDGSYYGLGYSGYAGDNWYGSYWYW
jgi:hypothetical protein